MNCSRRASNRSPPENICYPAKLVHGHIKWLLNKGITTIFYPCVSYEENLVPNTDNHYNCPVVANYRWSSARTCPNCARRACTTCAPISISPIMS